MGRGKGWGGVAHTYSHLTSPSSLSIDPREAAGDRSQAGRQAGTYRVDGADLGNLLAEGLQLLPLQLAHAVPLLLTPPEAPEHPISWRAVACGGESL